MHLCSGANAKREHLENYTARRDTSAAVFFTSFLHAAAFSAVVNLCTKILEPLLSLPPSDFFPSCTLAGSFSHSLSHPLPSLSLHFISLISLSCSSPSYTSFFLMCGIVLHFLLLSSTGFIFPSFFIHHSLFQSICRLFSTSVSLSLCISLSFSLQHTQYLIFSLPPTPSFIIPPLIHSPVCLLSYFIVYSPTSHFILSFCLSQSAYHTSAYLVYHVNIMPRGGTGATGAL